MTPVFIGGCHRSGTTMAGALLGAHPRCLTTPESQFKTDAFEGTGLPGNRDELARFLAKARNMRSLGRWNLEPAVFELQIGTETRYADLMQKFVNAYGETVGKTSFDFWIDHTPKNIRHLAQLFDEFPQAKAIHLIRDGRAVAASVMPLDWGPNTIVPTAHWWVHHLAFGLAAETHFGGDRVLRVRYEDLVMEPARTLEQVCSWLGVEFVDQMKQGGGFSHPGDDFRYHALIHQAPNASRAVAWKKSLSERQVRSFESRTRDLLPYLGYELQYEAAETDRLHLMESVLVEPFKVALNAPRHRLWLLKRDRR
jgi:hypothetical protein